MPRREAVLAAVLLGVASFAAADDAQQAAAAAAAAQGQGGGGYQLPSGVAQAMAGAQGQGAPGAAGGAPGAAGGGQKQGGGFQRALSAPVIIKKSDQKPDAGGGHAGKGGKGGKKKSHTPESKYMSRELMENSEHSYRFDSQGDPIRPGVKKRAGKPSAGASAGAEDSGEEPAACSDGRSCAGKGSDADAL